MILGILKVGSAVNHPASMPYSLALPAGNSQSAGSGAEVSVDIYAEAVLDAARSAKHRIAECPVVNVRHLNDGLKDAMLLIEGPFKHVHAVEEAQTVKLIT